MAKQYSPFALNLNYKPEEQTSSQFERVGYVEIDFGKDAGGGERVRQFHGLDFRFKVVKILNNYPQGFAEVSILGLDQDTINRLTELTTQEQAVLKQKRVRVYAGYKKKGDDNYKGDLICDMDIIYATPTTTPPEVWVTITAGVRYMDKKYRIDISLPDNLSLVDITYGQGDFVHSRKYSFKNLCEDVVRVINREYDKISKDENQGNPTFTKLELDWRLEEDDFTTDNTLVAKPLRAGADGLPYIPPFQESKKTVSEILERLNNYFAGGRKLWVFVDSGRNPNTDYLVVCPVAIKKKAEKAVADRAKAIERNGWFNKFGTVHYVDTAHGMIGLPSLIKGNELRCKMLLSPTIKASDWVKVDSKIIPKLNGYWVVNHIEHTGHFRGNEWYTSVVAYDEDKAKPGSSLK